MAETLILNAAVAVATVYENQARGSGKIFWNVVTDSKDRFTAFQRELVARLIDGRTPTTIPGRDGGPDSLAYNLNPPLNTMVFFEARVGPPASKVLVPTPEGAAEYSPPVATGPVVMPPPNPPGTLPLPGPTTPAPAQPSYKPPYRPNTGYQAKGGGWKPEDKRPGLVTMNEAYAKDIVTAIIGNSDDLKAQDPDAVLKWAGVSVLGLSEMFLTHTLHQLTTLGFKVEPTEGGNK